jgi:guanosine-3',5'-bis(diphosphate) 3'-pyrophosphohydrolase
MTTQIDRAMAIALRYHNGQVNQHDGEPYILHVQRVANHVRDRGLSETHQAIAWLHDVLEDTECTPKQIVDAFPNNGVIIQAVLALTKVKGISNEVYYTCLKADPVAAAVKISDLVDNFSRNHMIEDEATRVRMASKYSLGLDILKEFV